MKRAKITVLSIGLLFLAPVAWAQSPTATFEDPVLLKTGDHPINDNGKMMYPSPVMMDIDSDGQDELVIGTIFGAVYVCEDEKAGEPGDPAWSEPVAVKTADGNPLKLHNW